MTTTTLYQPLEAVAMEPSPADAGAPARRSPPSALAHILAWLGLATVFTLLVVNYSLNRGKLIVPAHYDDVSYLRDGLHKLNLFYKGGLQGLAYSISLKPPHSPFATAVAFAGYAIFGIHDWAPYAANGIIILGLLAFTDHLTQGLPPWQKLAAFCFVLSVPIAAQCVYEFRPDIAVGLMTAAFIMLLLEQPLVRASRRYLVMAGVLLGITLLSKTSVFPITLTFAGSALLAATVRDRVLLGREVNLRSVGRAWSAILIPGLLIPLPYYLFNRHEIYYYITVNALGANSDIWKLHASRSTHLLYYLTGEGSRVMLGRDFKFMMCVLIAGLVAVGLRRRQPEICRAACYLVLLATTYAVPTSNPIKDAYLAVVFDFLLVFVSLLIARAFLTTRKSGLVRTGSAVVWTLLVLASVYLDKWPMYWGEVTRPDTVRRNAYMRDLYEGILSHDPARTGQVLIGVSGVFVNADGLGYMADKDGMTSINFVSDFTDNNLAHFEQLLDKSQFVIIGDADNPEDDPHTPYSAMLDRTVPMVRSRHDFELIATCPTQDGKNYYLYQRRTGGT